MLLHSAVLGLDGWQLTHSERDPALIKGHSSLVLESCHLCFCASTTPVEEAWRHAVAAFSYNVSKKGLISERQMKRTLMVLMVNDDSPQFESNNSKSITQK